MDIVDGSGIHVWYICLSVDFYRKPTGRFSIHNPLSFFKVGNRMTFSKNRLVGI